jgi:hypothetical protein
MQEEVVKGMCLLRYLYVFNIKWLRLDYNHSFFFIWILTERDFDFVTELE